MSQAPFVRRSTVAGALCGVAVGGIAVAAVYHRAESQKGHEESNAMAERENDESATRRKTIPPDDSDDDVVKYTRGDVLRHVPKHCYEHVYLGVSALLANDAVTASVKFLREKIADSSDKDGVKVSRILDNLKSSGIDPTRDLKEVAYCKPNDDDDDEVTVLGGNFSGKDILATVSRAAKAGGFTITDKKEVHGIPSLKLDQSSFIGIVAPNVLAIVRSKYDLPDLNKSTDHTDDWKVEKEDILQAHLVSDINIDAQISAIGDDWALDLTLEGKAGSKLQSDPDAFKAEVSNGIDQAARKLRGTPFEAVARDIKKIKIDVDGSKVSMSLLVPSSHIADVIREAAEASSDDLKKALP